MGKVDSIEFLEKAYGIATIQNFKKIGVGHIHSSFKIDTSTGSYFLQEINHQIFPVEILSNNLEEVLNHLKEKDQEFLKIPSLVKTLAGKNFLKEKAKYWRLLKWEEGLRSYDNPSGIDQLFSGAKAYGYFDQLLSDLDPSKLRAVIPNFQSLKFRLSQLDEATKNCDESRLEETMMQLVAVAQYKKSLLKLEEAWTSELIPTRVVHNDTKFNNVMFDKSGTARCVVDLDTVMPGILHFDLGDGIRTTTSLSNEDEADLTRVKIDHERLKAFKNGFLEGFGSTVTSSEEALVPLAGPYMAFIMGVRFLTDYLNGNIYYTTSYPEQNLNRALCQLHLTGELLSF